MNAIDQGSHWKQRLIRAAEPVLGADIRSLAAFRVAVALLVIADLIARSFDLQAHYTDDGVLPRLLWLQRYSSWYVSVHLLSGARQVQAALFVLAGLCAAAMLVGHRTRSATCLLWFLTLSLHGRNPLVLYGADAFLRMLLFWSMFLPLGACWSVDRARSPKLPAPARQILSMGTVALLAQVMFVYFFSALHKTGPTWSDGTAAYYALNVDHMVRSTGKWFLSYPRMLAWATHAVYYFELLGPFLLLCPSRAGRVRTATVMIFMLLHAGFGSFFQLGFFPFVGMAAMLPFLPSWLWDRALVRRLSVRLAGIFTAAWARRRVQAGAARDTPQRRGVTTGQSFLGALACLFALVYVLLWNVHTLPSARFRLPPVAVGIAWALGFEQTWNMFAPDPLKDDGWFVLPGELSDGTELDILTGREVSWEKPALISRQHWGDRWQKYVRNLWERDTAWSQVPFAVYLCRHWKAPGDLDRTLERFDLYFMLEATPPPGERPTVEEFYLGEFDCRIFEAGDR